MLPESVGRLAQLHAYAIGKHRVWSTVNVHINELVDPTPMDYSNAKRVSSVTHLCVNVSFDAQRLINNLLSEWLSE